MNEYYWHFCEHRDGGGYLTNDLSGVRVHPGLTVTVEGQPVLCEYGLHASKRAIDALSYAPGSHVCLVALGSDVVHDSDKSVATERTVIAEADATRVLHEFAIWCAEQALALVDKPDPRSIEALAVKRRWLDGQATDEELAAAAAAWTAARTAARAAARTAAWTAAGDARTAARADAAAAAAARTAAWTAADAARTAAWDAADDAWTAARAAARDSQNIELERRLLALLEGDAARVNWQTVVRVEVMECMNCDGIGSYDGTECPACNGTGDVPYYSPWDCPTCGENTMPTGECSKGHGKWGEADNGDLTWVDLDD